MAEQTVTLTIQASGRTVQDEIIEAVAAQASDLPPDLEQTIASLSLLNDEELWQAARARVPADNSDRIEALLPRIGGLTSSRKSSSIWESASASSSSWMRQV
jgi:hypothetical protein